MNHTPRSILITGCSSGIGWHCANRLKIDGWDVHATARKVEDIDRLKEAGISAYWMDYSDVRTILDTFNAVRDNTDGRLDAVFNNGAYGQPGAVEDLSTNVLREQFEANFFGWHELTNLCVQTMRQQGHGRIVHCSSVLGFVAAPWRGAYNASKFALEGLAATMRLELAGSGIHVSIIQPGPIATRFSDNALAKFLQNVDIEHSIHRQTYNSELARLQQDRSSSIGKFTLPPDAVYKKLDHALTAKRPKAYYPVTLPTHFMGWAQRLMPRSWVDRLVTSST